MTQSAMEVPSEAEGHSDMVGERHDGREGMTRGKVSRVHEPIKVTTVLLSGAGSVGDSAMPVPLGREIQGGNVPITPDQPWHSAQDSECVLKVGEETVTGLISLGLCRRRTVNRKEMQALSTSPWDYGMSASGHGGPPMDLKGEADEDCCASTSPLVATGPSRIPEAMPTRLPGHELQAAEPGAEMPMFLDK